MITIKLPWPDKHLSPNARCHWAEKAEATQTAKAQGRYLALWKSTYRWDDIPECLQAVYIFHPPDKRRRDLDNIHLMCKPAQDGVCAALGIDDSRIKRTILEWGDVAKGGKVIMELEELDE